MCGCGRGRSTEVDHFMIGKPLRRPPAGSRHASGTHPNTRSFVIRSFVSNRLRDQERKRNTRSGQPLLRKCEATVE